MAVVHLVEHLLLAFHGCGEDPDDVARDAHDRVLADALRHLAPEALGEFGVEADAVAEALGQVENEGRDLEQRLRTSVARLEAELDQRLRHLVDVAREERPREVDDGLSEVRRQLLGEAEVDEDEARPASLPGLDDQVAGVRVRMEVAVDEHLLAVGLDQDARHLVRVESGLP